MCALLFHPTSLALNFLLVFFFRVKDHISSGLDNKIIDPDGGIHCSKKQVENNGNYRGNKVVE